MRSKKGDTTFQFRPKFLLVALLALGIGIYCLATGTDLTTYID